MLSRSTLVATLIGCFSLINAFGQQQLPPSFSQNRAGFDDIPVKILAPIPLKSTSARKAQQNNASFLKKREFGTTISTNINLTAEGRKDTVTSTIIHRLMVKSVGAKSLGLKLSATNIASFDSRKIFIYTPDRRYVFNTLAKISEGSSIILPTIPGDCAVVEVEERLGENAQFSISEVVHGDISPLKAYDIDKDISQSCNVDIACNEGKDWQIEKYSIVKIEIHTGNGIRLCTGTLINNTANNRRPYILTANHCIQTADQARNSIFYFGYEKKECGQDAIIQGQSISGSTLRATGLESKLDFTLVELNQTPPQSYQAYYAGWDIRKNPFKTAGATCLHHPNGDVKKISISAKSPIVGDYQKELDNTASFDPNSHWHVEKWDVGTTEGGSSGSPLFSNNHLVVGDLSGGLASCEQSVDDYYSAINRAWSDYNDPRYQLKAWLDPISKGDSTCNGAYASNLPYQIQVSNPFPCSGEAVNLTVTPEDPNLKITNLQADSYNEVNGVGTKSLTWTLTGSEAKDVYASLELNGTSLGSVFLVSVKPFPAIPTIYKKGLTLETSSSDLKQWYLDGNLLNNTTTSSIQIQGKGSYTMKAFTPFGCASTSNTIIVNYSDFIQPQNIVAYPVPVQNGIVHIKLQPADDKQSSYDIFDGDVTVNMYDIMGRKLKAELFKGPNDQIDFSLPYVQAGLYILEVVGGGKRIAKKIVVTGE